MSIHAYELIIKEAHLDTFGHVNNATYLELYEEARWELITARGYGIEKMNSEAKGPVILEVNLKFLRELRLREKIKITTELLNYDKKVGQLKQQIYQADGQLSSEAIFSFALFDLKERKLVEPTAAWAFAVGKTNQNA